MKAFEAIAVMASMLVGLPLAVYAQAPAQPLPFDKLAAECASDVHPSTLKGVVSTESLWNPYAIGVVGGRLSRQPRTLAEAVAAARELERKGFNFSLGLGQVNRYNLSRLGETVETVFDPCRNLKAGSAILKDCFLRAKSRLNDDQQALRAAFSCYYSGNFTRGFIPDKPGHPSYVQKVVANATDTAPPVPVVPAIQLESVDAAMLVRPASRSTGVATAKPAATSSPWVIFAHSPPPGGSTVLKQIGATEAPAVKAQRVTPASATVSTTDGRSGSSGPARDTARVPAPHSIRTDGHQDAAFVQFVN
jgi:type IV secretion system protein VirB1